jgi:hypothetical protein
MFTRYKNEKLWGTVCGSHFDKISAGIFCKTINKKYKFAKWEKSSHYSKGAWTPKERSPHYPIFRGNV